MLPLAAQLRARIEADGPISVEAWMNACLADPLHGYYMTRDPLGRAGDFTTAPEISQMFGELLGLWAGVVWQQIGAPSKMHFVEIGPGRGTLMKDALRALRGVSGVMDAFDVHMVETSPTLTKAQQKSLKDTTCNVTWHTDLATVPQGPVIILANEFLDALPIRQYIQSDGGWYERVVTIDDDQFAFGMGERIDDTIIPEKFKTSPDGSIYEDAPIVQATVQSIAGRVVSNGGAALIVDYGYAENALGETLQALSKHAYVDPLGKPGEHDLTTHVNFADVKAHAEAAGAGVWGSIEQGAFLERLGIAARAASLLANATMDQAQDIATARRRLVDPDAMGRLFKAIALTPPDSAAPPAFEAVRWA